MISMFSKLLIGLLSLALLGLYAGPAAAQATPTTAPTTARTTDAAQDPPRRDRFPFIDRLHEAIEDLRLSDDAERRLDDAFDKTRAKAQQFRDEIEDLTSEERRQRFRDIGDNLRREINDILTPEQKKELRENVGDAVEPVPPPGEFFERIREFLAELRLDDEQRAKIRELFDQTRSELDALREGLRAGDRSARNEAGEILRDARERLNDLLTPEQEERLRDLMRADAPDSPGASPPKESSPSTRPVDQGAMRMDADGAMMAEGAQNASREGENPAGTAIPPSLIADGPMRGDRAPDFTLERLAGPTVKLSSFKGRVVVIVFGSFTCPSFRNRAAGIDDLREDLGNRASVMVVYTREAHPADGWEVERNKDDGINLRQTRDDAEREAAAERAKEALKLSTPIVIDSVDDATAKAYGAFPNGAVVIDRDGTIAYRQQWFEPMTLRRHIDKAITGVAGTQPSDL